jgi:queuosine precursor transporter
MNELLLLVVACISAAFVVAGWRLGKERLYTVIAVLLILIATVGGKIITVFGYETNTGNIFYASVFLATYFLIERYGRREGTQSVWIGLIVVVFFSLLARITVMFAGSAATAPLNAALELAFAPVPRIMFASLCAYVLSQAVNVHLYLYLKREWGDRYVWLRANIANLVAQVLDSAVFFTIAFWGVVPLETLMEAIRIGLSIKILFMAGAAFLLYLNTEGEEQDKDGNVTLTIRY